MEFFTNETFFLKNQSGKPWFWGSEKPDFGVRKTLEDSMIHQLGGIKANEAHLTKLQGIRLELRWSQPAFPSSIVRLRRTEDGRSPSYGAVHLAIFIEPFYPAIAFAAAEDISHGRLSL